MKKQLLLILLLILQSFALLLPPVGSDWIIDGDTVYIDDENAYLSATPHTITQDTWVTFQVRSKDYEGDIDAVWLFNTTNCKPTKPVYYKIGEGNWTELTKEFTIESINYENMTRAYLLENINIQNNTDYYLKCFVDIKFNTSGKYWWGVKPSALGWDKGYYIDPWWNSSWNYYRLCTISNTYVDADLTNFPVLVNISAAISAKCNSGNSIRFLHTDNTTEYKYEIEGTWSSSSYNFVHVNITSVSSSSDTKFLMYYYNADATDNQDAANVWDSNFTAVYHMNSSSTSACHDSTSNAHNASYEGNLPSNNVSDDGGKIGQYQHLDGNDYIGVPLSCHIIGNGTWEMWVKQDSLSTLDTFYIDYKASGDYTYMRGNVSSYKWEGIKGGVHQWSMVAGTSTTNWAYMAHAYETNDVVGWKDATNETYNNTATPPTATPATKIFIGKNDNDANHMAGHIDEVRISNISRSDAWLKATYHSLNQDLVSMGVATTDIARAIINTTTGIQETNATLQGYIFGIGSGNYNYGFWIGTSTPVTEANADRNMTGIGTVTITGNSDFSHNDSNLSRGTQYYAKSWIKNNTYWDSSNNEEDFWTKCDVPSGFTATLSGCNVDLAWTKGTGADKTTVVRNATAYPANQTDGTVVYNNTASTYEDTTASGMGEIYYRAWSWAGDKHSDENVSANLSVPPCPPTSVDGAILANNTLNITWTVGTSANTTLVVRKIDSTPSSRTDGTVMYNSTGTHYVVTDLTENYYYRLWSYANGTYSTSVALDFGALVINCYSEETNASLYFDALVRNESGTQSYESRNNTNPLVINVVDNLPLGNDIRIIISPAENYSEKTETFTGYSGTENSTVTYVVLIDVPESKALTNVTCKNTSSWVDSYPAFTLADDVITILADAADEFQQIVVNYTHYEYDSRVYYRDLVGNHVYVLDAFLPNADDTELYVLQVIDDYDIPVEGADLEIKHSINGTYEIIASPITDANGKASVYLTPDEDHLVRISKTGYKTKNASFIPDPDYYGSYYPIIFRLKFEAEAPENETIADYITLKGTLNANDTLNVTYYDKNDETINTHFYIYEYYNNTRTYIGEYNGTTSSDFTFWKSSLNTSRMHLIVLFMNHTTLGAVENYVVYVSPLHEDKESGESLETHFIAVGGSWDYGWVNTLIWYLPCIIFIMAFAAAKHPGMGVMFAGMYCIFVSWYLLIPDEAKMLTFAAIMIVIGVIGIFLKRGRDMIH